MLKKKEIIFVSNDRYLLLVLVVIELVDVLRNFMRNVGEGCQGIVVIWCDRNHMIVLFLRCYGISVMRVCSCRWGTEGKNVTVDVTLEQRLEGWMGVFLVRKWGVRSLQTLSDFCVLAYNRVSLHFSLASSVLFLS